MSLRINDVAPNFTAETTEGPINFHEWIGDGWAVLFSHPKDFTPVCTTELGYMARIKPEFDKRNCKILGISVDGMSNHEKWSKDIEASQGHAINYPLIGDPQLKIVLSDEHRPKLRRDSAAARLVPFDGIAQGRDARELEAGRRRDHPACSFGRGGEEDLSRGLEVAAALHPNRSAASVTLISDRGGPASRSLRASTGALYRGVRRLTTGGIVLTLRVKQPSGKRFSCGGVSPA